MCAKKKKPVKAKTPAKKQAVKTKKADTPFYTSDPLFPVAAIGGSAGGIEARAWAGFIYCC